jgi:hypothetical protein
VKLWPSSETGYAASSWAGRSAASIVIRAIWPSLAANTARSGCP